MILIVFRRYYAQQSTCVVGASAAFLSVYHTVGNCNPTTKQIYSCAGRCVCVCVCVCVWMWNILCQHRVDRLEAVVGVIADLFDGEARVSSIDVSVLKLEM